MLISFAVKSSPSLYCILIVAHPYANFEDHDLKKQQVLSLIILQSFLIINTQINTET